MRVPAALALAAALAACGSGEPQGVVVTEAEPAGVARPPAPRPGLAFDTVYADSGLFADPRLDSLRADSVAADSTRAPAPAGPDFRAFWPQFRAAAREGRAAVADLTLVGEGGVPRAQLDALHEPAFEGLYREGVLDLTARDFRRDGPAREVAVVVGYDAAGRVVPEDEAVRETSLVLRFRPVDGAYRLVRLAVEE